MNQDPRGLSASFLEVGDSSFVDFAARVAPGILPRSAPGDGHVPHGTTIAATEFTSGVVVAGDRRATWGNLIAALDRTRALDRTFRRILDGELGGLVGRP